jgi:hypothetical protein
MRLVLTMRLAPPGGTHGREGKRAAGECSLRIILAAYVLSLSWQHESRFASQGSEFAKNG